jgi:hypothetical protein
MKQVKPTAVSLDVLDQAQLQRIEATHRGFLYQHFYGVACLLMVRELGWKHMRVEADEDMELEFSGRRLYVQIKSRSKAIRFSDISSALARFDQYRFRHASGSRLGQAGFVLALNQDVAPALGARIAAGEFHADVHFLYPGKSLPELPPTWVDNEEAFFWCIQKAEQLPFVMVAPDILVLNLAGTMLRIAAGLGEFAKHEVSAARAIQMLEQFVQQVHEFPAPPLNYRPQDNEPALVTDAPVRLIVGFSGAGKTSWAAQAALADERPCAYLDVADLSSSSVARALARELAARWLSDTPHARQAVGSEALSGVEALRLVASSLVERELAYTVVIDNAHRLQAIDAQAITSALGGLRLVFLAQPTAELDLISAALDVVPETLLGWGMESIAHEALSQDCKVSVSTAIRVRRLTAGLPLYVRSAIIVAKEDYSSNVDAFCDAFEGHLLSADTRQHTLLRVVFDGLDERSRQVLACASLADVPLEAKETAKVVRAAFLLDEASAVRTLRSLRARGLLQAFGSQRSKVHDAMRPIAQEYLVEDAEASVRARMCLRDLVEHSLRERHEIERFPLFIGLLVALQEVETLANFGTEEAFHELRDFPEMWPVLEDAAQDASLSAEVRFECLDALLYYRQRHGPKETTAPLLQQMRALPQDSGSTRPRLVYLQKSVLHWASLGDEVRVQELLDEAKSLLPNIASYRRVFSYSAALAMWKLSKPVSTAEILNNLVTEYHSLLRIDVETLVADQARYAARARLDEDYDADCKRLADCYDLLARVRERLGKARTQERKLAVSLFLITCSWDSAVRVGVDLAYQHLDRGELAQTLRLVSDFLPPLVSAHGLEGHTIILRSLHAHVLARMGQIVAAKRVFKSVEPFIDSLPENEKADVLQLTSFLR